MKQQLAATLGEGGVGQGAGEGMRQLVREEETKQQSAAAGGGVIGRDAWGTSSRPDVGRGAMAITTGEDQSPLKR